MKARDPFRYRAVARIADNGVARSSVRVIQLIRLESQRSRVPQMAAALSYRTVFGLLPMVIVALVGLRIFITDAEIDQFVDRTLQYAGLDVIAVDRANDESAFWETAVESENGGVAPAAEPPVVTPAEVSRNELVETIRSLISRAKSIDYRAVGAAGAITLIYAALSMLTEVERAFNQIFSVPIGKPWRRRMTEYWALLTLGTPCLLATFFVGERAKSLVAQAVESAGFSATGVVGIALSGYAITVLISAALLMMAYMLLPNTRVRIVPALAGALLAAVLWEAGKWGFTQYIRYSTNYARLYGSIALIPLFLLWIYSTWAIVLFGLQVTYHIQRAREKKNSNGAPIEWTLPPSGVVDPGVAVAIAHTAARAFFAGKPVSLTSLVQTVRVQGSVITDVVTRLVEANILHRVATPDDPHGVTLAMPPDRIKVRDVLEIGYDLAGPIPGVEDVLPGVRARLRDTHLKAAGSATIADLLTSGSTPLRPLGANSSQPLLLAEPPEVRELVAPLPPSSDAPGETWVASDANPYPQGHPADTLPLVDQGEPDRDQETDQNSLGDGDPARGPVRDPGVL